MKKTLLSPENSEIPGLLKLCLCLLLILPSGKVFARPVTAVLPVRVIIRGQVTDEDNRPLSGVSVRPLSGLKNATATDAAGKFSIVLNSIGDKLVFTYIGYERQEILPPVAGGLSVLLKPVPGALNEVVINGYGGEKKSLTTGAVSQVVAKDLESSSFTSVDQNLQGRVPGLQSLGTTGQPGALQEIRIRGTGSLTAGADPLYVVNGVIINAGQLSQTIATSNALATIDPNDIESVNVLKDAAATAIYGSRAANGVIVITTKAGAKGAPKMFFDASYGLAGPGHLPAAGQPLNTDEWRTLTAEGILNNPTFAAQNGLNAGNVMNYVNNTLGAGSGVSTNWLALVQRTARQQQYHMAVSGGNDNTQYRIAGSYFDQQGTTIASGFNRYAFNADLKTNVNKRLTISTTLLIGETGQNTNDNTLSGENPLSQAIHLLPFVPAYNADGSLNINPAQFDANGIFNPLYVALNDKSHLSQLKGVGSLSADYQVINGLTFSSRIGLDYNNLEEDYYNNPTDGNGIYYNGLSTRDYTRYLNWIWTNMLDYHFSPDQQKNWNVNLKAGYEAQKSSLYYLDLSVTGLPASSSLSVPSNGSSVYNYAGTNDDYTVASMFTLGDINYKGKYVLSASFRRDGASKFSEDNRYGNFWSVGGSWNAQEEDFIKELSWVNTLKLRTSYGLTGNANIGSYAWRQLYSYGVSSVSGTSFNYNGQTGSGPTSVGNPDLTWETNKQFDIGTDLAVLQNRLAFSFDYYNRTSANLLLDQPTSLTTGYSSFINNVGTMRNRGVELGIYGTPVVAGDFKWHAGFNISNNNNKILSLVDSKDILVGSSNIERVGLDSRTFYLRQWAGVDPANGSPLWYTDATRTKTTSNYNLANPVAGHSAAPKVFGSITSTFSYRQFSLDAMAYYNFGNYVQDLWAQYSQSDGAYTPLNQYASELKAWQKPGDITNTPIYIFNNSNNSSRVSSRFLYRGDYIRLRELTASYDFPAKLLTGSGLAALKIYARATNLLTWVRDKNLPFDPESGLSGQSDYNVPMPHIITLGVNMQF